MLPNNVKSEAGLMKNEGYGFQSSIVGSIPHVSEERHMRQININDNSITHEQLLRYAEDLGKIYQQEQSRRNASEKACEELKREVQSRQAAEHALQKAHEELEDRVRERTHDLCEINQRLEHEVAQRISAEKRIREQLEEKEVLLSEIHHRVKNNLQMICSLLSLQRSNITDEKVLGALNDSWCRVRAIALIHELLYRSHDMSRIDLAEYINTLMGFLNQAYTCEAESISVNLNLEKVYVSIDSAVPFGLIVNELITNCLRHAFPAGRDGEITVELKRSQDEGYTLVIADDGTGLPNESEGRSPNSLGLDLIYRLVRYQLDGEVNIRADAGTTVSIHLPHLK